MVIQQFLFNFLDKHCIRCCNIVVSGIYKPSTCRTKIIGGVNVRNPRKKHYDDCRLTLSTKEQYMAKKPVIVSFLLLSSGGPQYPILLSFH